MSRIVKLAITGSIGSGKSVVSRMMNVLGVPVYDCDANAKRLMTENEYIVGGVFFQVRKTVAEDGREHTVKT